MESRVGANHYQVKMKINHVKKLKKYSLECQRMKWYMSLAVAGVIDQDTDPEMGEVPDLERYCQRDVVRDVKLGEDLSKTSGMN